MKSILIIYVLFLITFLNAKDITDDYDDDGLMYEDL